MNGTDDSGPRLPLEVPIPDPDVSLRDDFAKIAMKSLMDRDGDTVEIGRRSYLAAYSMMAARAKDRDGA